MAKHITGLTGLRLSSADKKTDYNPRFYIFCLQSTFDAGYGLFNIQQYIIDYTFILTLPLL